jgi:hypothetical protein
VDDAYEARAEQRRLRMQGGVAGSFEALDQAGIDYWQAAPGGARLEAIWQTIVDAWVVGGRLGPAPRFDGSTWGIGRFER